MIFKILLLLMIVSLMLPLVSASNLCPKTSIVGNGSVTYVNFFNQSLNTTDSVIFHNVTTEKVIITSDVAIEQPTLQSFWLTKYGESSGLSDSGIFFNLSSSQMIIKVLTLDAVVFDIANAVGSPTYGNPSSVNKDIDFTTITSSSRGRYAWDFSEKEWLFYNDTRVKGNLTAEGNFSAKWYYEPEFISIETHTNTQSSNAKQNPFSSSNYSSYVYHFHAGYGVQYNENNGTFIINKSGVYEITPVIVGECGGVSLMRLELDINGIQEWNATFTIHSSVDPLSFTGNIFHTFNSGDSVEFNADGVQSCTINEGSTFNIKKISNIP